MDCWLFSVSDQFNIYGCSSFNEHFMSMIKYNICFFIIIHFSKLKSGFLTFSLFILYFTFLHIDSVFIACPEKNPQNFICSFSVLFAFYSIFLSSSLNFLNPWRGQSFMQLATSAQCNFLDFLLKISFYCWDTLCYWFSSSFSFIFSSFFFLLFPSAIQIPWCHCNWLSLQVLSQQWKGGCSSYGYLKVIPISYPIKYIILLYRFYFKYM